MVPEGPIASFSRFNSILGEHSVLVIVLDEDIGRFENWQTIGFEECRSNVGPVL